MLLCMHSFLVLYTAASFCFVLALSDFVFGAANLCLFAAKMQGFIVILYTEGEAKPSQAKRPWQALWPRAQQIVGNYGSQARQALS